MGEGDGEAAKMASDGCNKG